MRVKKPLKFRSVLLYALFLLALTELALRSQQAAGPIYDFEFRSLTSDGTASWTLNHKPSASEDYNQDGIQNISLRAPETSRLKPFTFLFMGDSFMQGYPPGHTVPEFIRDQFWKKKIQRPMRFLNAGHSSYAPLIYTVQAKKLIPLYKPDFLVADIDESDLVDDYALYRPWTVRDAVGKITAVLPSGANQIKLHGYENLKKLPLYTLRLFGMWLHKIRLYFVFENYRKDYKGKYYENALSDSSRRYSFNLVPAFDDTPGWQNKYSAEKAFFEKSLSELMDTLVNLMGSPEKILILYHPHLNHLEPDSRGFQWRRNVTPLLEKAAAQRGIGFYDATADVKKAFGPHPADYYVENDMHFNVDGLEIYARLSGEKILERLPELTAPE